MAPVLRTLKTRTSEAHLFARFLDLRKGCLGFFPLVSLRPPEEAFSGITPSRPVCWQSICFRNGDTNRLPVKSALDLKQERLSLFGAQTSGSWAKRTVPERLIGSVTKYLPVSGYGMVKSAPARSAADVRRVALPNDFNDRVRSHVRGRADVQDRSNNAGVSGPTLGFRTTVDSRVLDVQSVIRSANRCHIQAHPLHENEGVESHPWVSWLLGRVATALQFILIILS